MSQNRQNIENENLKNNPIIDEKLIENSHKNETKNKLKFISKKDSKIVLYLLFVAIIGIGVGFYVGKEFGRSLPINHRAYSKSQVLATIQDVKITGEDLEKRMNPFFYYKGLKKLSDEEIESQETNTLNYMTNLEALYKAGVEDGIEISNEELSDNYSKTMSTITTYFNLTEKEFLSKFDLTENYIKENLKKEIIATQYLQNNSEVSEEEAKNYYNNNKEDFFEVRASHILISNYDEDGKELSDEKKKENKELAEKILKRAQSGESFDNLALEYSDDEATASNGGDLGYFSEGQMDENFEKAAFSLENNEIYSKVVETSYGYHIIKKTGQKYSDFEDEKDSLIEALTSNKQNTLLQDALEKYNVKINM